ncbi:MAG: DUF1553 domain-containing protein, partial [Armatimonadetes bacterium]|nr:DUF1553 domain-containing protein [Armatimonadota bacterium]
GAAPSHPELLEYLAERFVASGWSARAVHRLILNSAAYRQSGSASAAARRRDEPNRLYSRYPVRRLDAEAIRDSMLAASGELDLRVGGRYVPTQRDGDGDVVVAESSEGARRRSVYLQQRRTQIPGLLEVFDAPSIVTNCTARPTTTVPLQALKLLNSGFVRSRAAALARRTAAGAALDLRARVDSLFQFTLGRPARPAEHQAAREFLAAQTAEYAGKSEAEQQVWTDFCQMLLASNAFLFLE